MRFTTIAAIVVCAVNTGVLTAGAEKAKSKAAAAARPKPAATAETKSVAATAAPNTVTITGCVERDDNEFRLTDTAGTQVPKSRSWKSGFLKKRASDIDVVESSTKTRLRDHVGHRDALTGTMTDNDSLRVQWVRHLAASCEN